MHASNKNVRVQYCTTMKLLKNIRGVTLRKKIYVLSCLVLAMISIVGCKETHIQSEQADVEVLEVGTTTEVTTKESQESEYSWNDDINEYAIYVNDIYYPLDNHYIFETVLEDAEVQEFSGEFPYPSGKIHFGNGLKISTFNVNDERGQGETIYNILATKDAKTPRGVGIGDTLSDLQESYSELKYEANWVRDEENPMFNRVYIYTTEGSSKYIAFFLYEKEIVMIAVEEGFDYIPGIDIENSNILGIQGVLREVDNISSKGMNIHYFYTDSDGEEITLINIYARSTYEVDIDDDGIIELMVYLNNEEDWQSIGIYDVVNGEISYIDVNKKMGCKWSRGEENCANIKPEYKKCIEIGFERDDDTYRSGLYRVVDNELFYICPFSDDVLM
ncbi:MAG: hypothetical protein CVU98_00765 [Firmicutes bacterium HGW-Firmicutes-3]|nr:MAG: hypothetical protein CVU98_00765 [Firmicutes bacterium HGW-Firmicutes-3]